MFLIAILIVFGIGLIPLLPKSLPNILRILFSPAFSLIIFCHFLLMVSLLKSFNYVSISISLFFISLLSVVSVISNFKKMKQVWNIKIKDLPINFLLIAFTIVVFLALIWLKQALSMSGEGLKTGGGGMYGDTALHSAYTSRIETGEFPPQNPLFAGKILVYPFANDLLSASLRFWGLNYNLAFAVPQILFLLAFLVLFKQTSKKLVGVDVFVVAICLLLLGWGVGFYYFIREFVSGNFSFWESLRVDYTHLETKGLFFHNILTGLILPERSFLPGLVLGLLFYNYFFDYLKNKDRFSLAASAIVWGMLPFWHTHTFIFISISVFCFAFFQFFKKYLLNTIGDFSLMISLAVLVSLPFTVLFLKNHELSSFLRLSFGWQENYGNILFFWLKNSFLILPLTVMGYLKLKKQTRMFFWGSIVTFLVANFVIFQPWDWDNIKLFSWSFLFFCILCAFYLKSLYQKNLYFKILTILILIVSSLSGLLSLLLQVKNTYVAYDNFDIEIANWAKTTSVNSVFVIEPTPSHPIPGLSGKMAYIGYPGHLWVHGINYSEREVLNSEILSGDFSKLRDTDVHVKYLVLPRERMVTDLSLTEVFRNDKYLVYENLY